MAYFNVFSRRWGSEDHYRVKRISTGWLIEHISIGGECDKTGRPFLYDNFKQDSINWPIGLPNALATLWDYAEQHGLTDEQLQPHLDKLGQWVTNCERGRPTGDVLNI
jgi:hypothetical protein